MFLAAVDFVARDQDSYGIMHAVHMPERTKGKNYEGATSQTHSRPSDVSVA